MDGRGNEKPKPETLFFISRRSCRAHHIRRNFTTSVEFIYARTLCSPCDQVCRLLRPVQGCAPEQIHGVRPVTGFKTTTNKWITHNDDDCKIADWRMTEELFEKVL